MGDFTIPSFDFGGVGDDLDFSLSDVRRGGKSDGIETCRYDRPRIYDNVLDEVEYEHAQEEGQEEKEARRRPRRRYGLGLPVLADSMTWTEVCGNHTV